MGFTAIEGGAQSGLALDATGTIHGWGDDGADQVSNIPPGAVFTAIAAGDEHSQALDATGTIHSWGDDSTGEVSDTPPGTGFTAIASGDDHSLALRDWTLVPLIDIQIYWEEVDFPNVPVLHPHHDGSGSNQDDVIPVIMYSSSTLVGDSSDFDASLIDPATLRFGPGLGTVSPSDPPSLNIDIDDDGLDDAVFRFLMSDATFGRVTCSEDTSGVLIGGLITGETFAGEDSFLSNCNASCH
jgi:hypothetical protein